MLNPANYERWVAERDADFERWLDTVAAPCHICGTLDDLSGGLCGPCRMPEAERQTRAAQLRENAARRMARITRRLASR